MFLNKCDDDVLSEENILDKVLDAKNVVPHTEATMSFISVVRREKKSGASRCVPLIKETSSKYFQSCIAPCAVRVPLFREKYNIIRVILSYLCRKLISQKLNKFSPVLPGRYN